VQDAAIRLASIAFAFMAGAALAAPRVALPQGDAQTGAEIYARCGACHALTYDRTGPHHCGLFGRRAGSVPGFEYSAAMKHSQIVWSRATLDDFIAHPTKTIPGTSMGYAGVTDPRERADLIAYLWQANHSAVCKTIRPPSK
jgi:cytochrome c